MTRYTAFYCEENIWHLANDAVISAVIFVSNPLRQVACFEQQQAPAPGQPMMWDYHVIGFANSSASSIPSHRTPMIWDYDTALPKPMNAIAYLSATFPYLNPAHQQFSPWFRICSAKQFVHYFSSDRRHMRNVDGSWQQQPPAWPCIRAERSQANTSEHNLDQFLTLSDASTAPGLVLIHPSYDAIVASCLQVESASGC